MSKQSHYLALFFQDHDMLLLGAHEIATRFIDASEFAEAIPAVEGLLEEIDLERDVVHGLMGLLGIQGDLTKSAIAWISEKFSRLKRNGHLLTRSPLSDMIELETLSMVLHGCELFWNALAEIEDEHTYIAQVDPQAMIERIQRRREQIDDLYCEAASHTLRTHLETL